MNKKITVLKEFSKFFKDFPDIPEEEEKQNELIIELADSLTEDLIEECSIPKKLLSSLGELFLELESDAENKPYENLVSLGIITKTDKKAKRTSKSKSENKEPTRKEIEEDNKIIDEMNDDDPDIDDIKEKIQPKKTKVQKEKIQPKKRETKKEEIQPKKRETKKEVVIDKQESINKKERSGIYEDIRKIWKKNLSLNEIIDIIQEKHPSVDKKKIYTNCRWVRYGAQKSGHAIEGSGKGSNKKWKLSY